MIENVGQLEIVFQLTMGGSTCNSRWLQDYPDLPKIVYIYIYIYLQNIYIYTHTKLTYFDHPNENIDHSHLRITKI